MIVETLRLLTDWANDPTTGFAAKLALLTLDGSDTVPAIGTIADETRNNLVALNRLPSTNGIAVNLQQIPLLDGEVTINTRDGWADVLFRIGRTTADAMNAVRDTSYIARAGIQSLRDFNASTRTRNGISLCDCQHLAIVPLWESIEDQVVTHGIKGRWQFRDTNV